MLTRAVLGFVRRARVPRTAPVFVHEAAPLPPMPPGWCDRRRESVALPIAIKHSAHLHNAEASQSASTTRGTSATLRRLATPPVLQDTIGDRLLPKSPSFRDSAMATPSPASKLKHVVFADNTLTISGSGNLTLLRPADVTDVVAHANVTPPRSSAKYGSLPRTPDSRTGFVRRRVMEMS